MSKFEHRGYEIEMNEGPAFVENGFRIEGNRIIYSATSDLGKAFAHSPQEALDDAKGLIDRVLEEGV